MLTSGRGAKSGGPSEVISHYLEAIYYMRGEGEIVRSARLADWLSVSRPTVTVALRRMIRDGMIRVNSRKEIELTKRGDHAATSIVRRHRITERWLNEVLGLDWVAADTEAARLEHAVSQQVEDRLYQALQRPTTCPHGNPIPGYAVPSPREVRLSDLPARAAATVSRISEVAEREAPALLHYLEARRLVPSTVVRILEVDEIGRTVRLRVRARDLTMSYETAGKIWVIPERPSRTSRRRT
jgi:DtxR family transcriptional regulator, iron-dependent repressor